MNKVIEGNAKLVIIYLLTVIITGSLLTYLGINNISNYRELTKKRILEEQEDIADQYQKELDQVLDSLGNLFAVGISYDKGNISGVSAKGISQYTYFVFDSNGTLLKPLFIYPGRKTDSKPHPAFLRSIKQGESDEFAGNKPGRAFSKYSVSLVHAGGPHDSVLAYNAMARVCTKQGLDEKARDYYFYIIKEFGSTVNKYNIPYAYLAMHQIIKEKEPRPTNITMHFLVSLLSDDIPLTKYTVDLIDDILESNSPDQEDGTYETIDSLCSLVMNRYELTLDYYDNLKRNKQNLFQLDSARNTFELITGHSANSIMLLNRLKSVYAGMVIPVNILHEHILDRLNPEVYMFYYSILLISSREEFHEGRNALLTPFEFPYSDGKNMVILGVDDHKQVDRYILKRELLTASGLLLMIIVSVLGFYILLTDIRRKRKMDLLRADFVANVTHELKTPLTSIHMFADSILMGKTKSAAKLEKYARVILKESEKLKRMVNNILEFSRKENKGLQYALKETRLDKVIEEILEETAYWLEINKFKVGKEIGSNISAMADAEGLKQVMSNLISNAIKYSNENNTIIVRLYEDDGKAVIEVEDNGIGIPRDQQKLIFKKFYRVNGPHTQQVSGTGLGLTVSHDIITAMGGQLNVLSKPGKGSTFTILLGIK